VKLLTVGDVAEMLRITPHGVRAMIRKGTLKAEMIGRDYLIKESDFKNMKRPGKGRPKRGD
jgi:excisionase family DNA binding protein